MPATIIEQVKGSELPTDWARLLRAAPNSDYVVTIQTEEERSAAQAALRELMDRVGHEAEKNGMTPAALSDILATDIRGIL